MHASLPMYDFPSIRGATGRFWKAIQAALGHGPQTLSSDGNLWDNWLRPDLLLSQTCGLPYRSHLHGKVQLVATPDYGLPGCGPGEYNSVFVSRQDDPRQTLSAFAGAIFAANAYDSQSGWAAPILHARQEGIQFGHFIISGAHLASAQAVASGQADLACLDALSWHFIQCDESVRAALHVVEATQPSPATPYITSLSQDAGRVRSAMQHAFDQMSKEDRAALSLHGIVYKEPAEYLAVPTPAPPKL